MKMYLKKKGLQKDCNETTNPRQHQAPLPEQRSPLSLQHISFTQCPLRTLQCCQSCSLVYFQTSTSGIHLKSRSCVELGKCFRSGQSDFEGTELV